MMTLYSCNRLMKFQKPLIGRTGQVLLPAFYNERTRSIRIIRDTGGKEEVSVVLPLSIGQDL